LQTFVPYANAAQSAAMLDNKRLNKQLLEGRQIYKILSSGKQKGGWVNHPAVKMWRGYDVALFNYLCQIVKECIFRGIKTENNWNAIKIMHRENWFRGDNEVMPFWWGDERVHQSHRNNLYAKDPLHYAIFSNDERVNCCDRCNYFWPTHNITL
jgi:hypothetical protein